MTMKRFSRGLDDIVCHFLNTQGNTEASYLGARETVIGWFTVFLPSVPHNSRVATLNRRWERHLRAMEVS